MIQNISNQKSKISQRRFFTRFIWKALSKYQIVNSIIQSRITELENVTLLKKKWKSLEKGLKEEEEKIREIMKSCDVFKNIYTVSGTLYFLENKLDFSWLSYFIRLKLWKKFWAFFHLLIFLQRNL